MRFQYTHVGHSHRSRHFLHANMIDEYLFIFWQQQADRTNCNAGNQATLRHNSSSIFRTLSYTSEILHVSSSISLIYRGSTCLSIRNLPWSSIERVKAAPYSLNNVTIRRLLVPQRYLSLWIFRSFCCSATVGY